MDTSSETLLLQQAQVAECSDDLQTTLVDQTPTLGPHLGDIRVLCARTQAYAQSPKMSANEQAPGHCGSPTIVNFLSKGAEEDLP